MYDETKDVAKITKINDTTYQRKLFLGTQDGVVTIAMTVDQGFLSLKVFKNGEQIKSTDGFISRSGYLQFYYELGDEIIVESESSDPADVWKYEASCPVDSCFAFQSSDNFDTFISTLANLGDRDGTVRFTADIVSGSLSTKIYRNGSVIKQTDGFVSESGYLEFYYYAGDEIVVETERDDPANDQWSYNMTCPYVDKCSYRQASDNYEIITNVHQEEYDLEYELEEPLRSDLEYRVSLSYTIEEGSLGLKVIRNGTVIEQTDGLQSIDPDREREYGRLKFRYNKGDTIVIESESSSLDDKWSYTVSCPNYHCSFIISSDEYEVTGTSHTEIIDPEGFKDTEGYIVTLSSVVSQGSLGFRLYMNDELVIDREGNPVDTQGLSSEGQRFRFNYYRGRTLRIESNSSSPTDDWEYRVSCPRKPGDGRTSDPTDPYDPYDPTSPSPSPSPTPNPSPSPTNPNPSPMPTPTPNPPPKPDPDEEEEEEKKEDVCPYILNSTSEEVTSKTHTQEFKLGKTFEGAGYKQDGVVTVSFNVTKGNLGLKVIKNGEVVTKTDGLIPDKNIEPPTFNQKKRDPLKFDYVKGDSVSVESTSSSMDDVWSYKVSCPRPEKTPEEVCPFTVNSDDSDFDGLINQKELSYENTPEGIITLDYDVTTGSVSLKAIVNGEVKNDTGGMISGTGSIEFEYASRDKVVIESESSDSSAVWTYTASCVEEIPYAAIINVGYPEVSEFKQAIIVTGYPEIREDEFNSAIIVTGYSEPPEGEFDSAIIATGYSQVPEGEFDSAIIATGYSQAPDNYFEQAIFATGYTYPSYYHFKDAIIATGHAIPPSENYFDEALISVAYTYPSYYHFKEPIVAVGYPVFSHDHFYTDTEFMVAAGYYKR